MEPVAVLSCVFFAVSIGVTVGGLQQEGRTRNPSTALLAVLGLHMLVFGMSFVKSGVWVGRALWGLMAAEVGLITTILILSPQPRRLMAFLCGWAVPGLGHLSLGRPIRAGLLAGMILVSYLAGLWMVNFRMVGFDDNPFYYVGQFGSGLTTLLGQLLSFEKAYPRPGWSMLLYDPGLLLVSLAGLLNYVAALNVFETPQQAETA